MSEQFDHGYALLIGVGNTIEPGFSMPVTVNDTQALQAILTDENYCSYPNTPNHIRLLNNQEANLQSILDGLNWLRECTEKDPDATAIVYYSGHGMFRSIDNTYYFLQHDFNRENIVGTALSFQLLNQKLGLINAKRLWVIIDSCYSAGLTNSKNLLSGDFSCKALPKGLLDSLNRGEGRAVFTSSRENQESWVHPSGNLSLYTNRLLEALKGAANQPGDTFVTIFNIMTHLGKMVPNDANNLFQKEQIPFCDATTEDFPIALLRGGKGISHSLQKTAVINPCSKNITAISQELEMAIRVRNRLKLQVIGLGLLTPPHIIIDLENVEEKILELEKELENINE